MKLAAVVFIIITDRISDSPSQVTLRRAMLLLLMIKMATNVLVFGFP